MIRVVISAVFALLLFAAPDAQKFTDWSPPESLGINTQYADQCVTISKNGLSLFFFSNRYDTGHPNNPNPALHLYVAQRTSVDVDWGEPQEIVGFNDGYAAVCPQLSLDEHNLFFTSTRTGCGGYDLWVSRRHDRKDDFGWEPPVNLGCAPDGPNSDKNETGPTVFEDEETGEEVLYFISTRFVDDKFKSSNIWESRRKSDDTFGPAMFVSELSSYGSDAVAVRRNGLEAILWSNRPSGTGIAYLWTSKRTSTADPWPDPVPLLINNSTVYAYGHMCFSFKGDAFYFTYDGPGVKNPDLYVITREKMR
jgi:hypothetical protein